MFACGVEHGDHVLEVHAGAVKRRHRQGKVRVADLDGDRQVLEKLLKHLPISIEVCNANLALTMSPLDRARMYLEDMVAVLNAAGEH